MDASALAAVERSIEALGRGDPAAARMAVSAADDRSGPMSRVADAVHLAAWRLEQDDEIDEATWNHLSDALGAGPLRSLVEQVRG